MNAWWRQAPTALAVAWLALLATAALFADLLPLADPAAMALGDRNALPSAAHPLGTDAFGRDLLSRIVYGARVSLLVAFLCPLFALGVGGGAGIVAGLLKGPTERLTVLFTDVLLALPALLVAMLLATTFGGSVATVLLVLALLSAPVFVRVARARTLIVTRMAYVAGARALGARTLWILHRHVVPNVLPTLANLYLLVAATVIVLEGALSFLGLGVSAPTASWGGMISEGRALLERRPHVALTPAAALVLTVLSLNTLGGATVRTPDAAMSR